MQKPIYISLLLLLLSWHNKVKAQASYLPGWVVTQRSDTLYGTVKDRSTPPFMRLHQKIRFKGKGPFVKKFSAAQVKSYARGETIFESHWLQAQNRLLQTEYRSNRGQGRQVFLKLRERGTLSYYHLEQLDPESGTIDEVDLFKRSGENYFIRVTQGVFGLRRNALEQYFNDCLPVVEKIRNRQLRTPLEIAKEYNQLCKTLRLN